MLLYYKVEILSYTLGNSEELIVKWGTKWRAPRERGWFQRCQKLIDELYTIARESLKAEASHRTSRISVSNAHTNRDNQLPLGYCRPGQKILVIKEDYIYKCMISVCTIARESLKAEASHRTSRISMSNALTNRDNQLPLGFGSNTGYCRPGQKNLVIKEDYIYKCMYIPWSWPNIDWINSLIVFIPKSLLYEIIVKEHLNNHLSSVKKLQMLDSDPTRS